MKFLRFIASAAALAIVVAACSTQPVGPGNDAVVIRNFSFPWSASPAPRTEFRAAIVGDRWHFSFDAEDHDIVVAPEWRGESTLDGEDRVEIFFARDTALEHYFCIEIDSLGRVHDYAASHYRKFDGTWNCPGLKTSARRTSNGYRVEGNLPLASLDGMVGKPVHRGDTVLAGLFRAEFYGHEERTRGAADDNWISWVKPEPRTPDFHVPSAFAELRLR